MLATIALTAALLVPQVHAADFAGRWTVRLYARIPPSERGYRISLDRSGARRWEAHWPEYVALLGGKPLTLTVLTEETCHVLRVRQASARRLRGRGKRFEADCLTPLRHPHRVRWEARRR